MKRILLFLSFILLIIVITFSCERDDICPESTETTPRLIIEFYDFEDSEVLKNVPRLTVYGEGIFVDDNGVPFEPEEATDGILLETSAGAEPTFVFNTNKNRIALPLKIADDLGNDFVTTRFILERDTNLRLDTENPTTSNKDILEIRYNSEFIYVSRACGYKSLFNSLEVEENGNDGSLWIRNIIEDPSLESGITNENTTHVRILH
ncbi:MAG: hypothetical protein AB8B52_05375 [Winogradskyella sp.]|uniref:DUF6452 family protein n=1 Tax=Winogradskyella sp. TaxID=1883156 RepID=UPI00385DAE08